MRFGRIMQKSVLFSQLSLSCFCYCLLYYNAKHEQNGVTNIGCYVHIIWAASISCFIVHMAYIKNEYFFGFSFRQKCIKIFKRGTSMSSDMVWKLNTHVAEIWCHICDCLYTWNLISFILCSNTFYLSNVILSWSEGLVICYS